MNAEEKKELVTRTWTAFGKGDIKGMLAELKRQGYKGYLSIEYEYGDLKHLMENLPKCIAYFDNLLRDA